MTVDSGTVEFEFKTNSPGPKQYKGKLKINPNTKQHDLETYTCSFLTYCSSHRSRKTVSSGAQ